LPILPCSTFWRKIYFKEHAEISIVANVGSFLMIRDILLTKEVDVLVLDLELKVSFKYFEVKSIEKFPKQEDYF
jgi:hypothetical protein